MQREDPAIGVRVSHDKDDEVDGTVAALQRTSAIHRLNIADPRLCLHSDGDTTDADERVPGATIPGNWQRNLGLHPDRGREVSTEPSQEGELARVEGWIAARHGPDEQTKPDCGTCTACLVDRDLFELGPFNPTELSVRHPDANAGRALAQPRR